MNKARGIYRETMRSSRGHFVKVSGLRWISMMLLAPVPFARRVWALPFLTALAPPKHSAQTQARRYKPLTDWSRQLLLLLTRWLPDKRFVAVADTSYAAVDLLKAVHCHVAVITRLRLDARLFFPPPRLLGTKRTPARRGRASADLA